MHGAVEQEEGRDPSVLDRGTETPPPPPDTCHTMVVRAEAITCQ